MLKAFSTAATGMSAQQTMIDSIANNLANMNTNGYKRAQVNFQDLLYLKLREAGREISSGIIAPSGLEIGSGVRLSSTNKVFTIGEIWRSREMDFLRLLWPTVISVTRVTVPLIWMRTASWSTQAVIW
jgi:flagellar hook-basal body protein